jgi:hypothetical protein
MVCLDTLPEKTTTFDGFKAEQFVDSVSGFNFEQGITPRMGAIFS